MLCRYCEHDNPGKTCEELAIAGLCNIDLWAKKEGIFDYENSEEHHFKMRKEARAEA